VYQLQSVERQSGELKMQIEELFRRVQKLEQGK
jgi:hypothetical protein